MARLRRLERMERLEREVWATRLLQWAERGLRLEAETGSARYFVTGGPYEAIAWCEVKELGGRRRVELGSHGSVRLACDACERDAQRRAQDRRAARG
jgi:hypothetical protein